MGGSRSGRRASDFCLGCSADDTCKCAASLCTCCFHADCPLAKTKEPRERRAGTFWQGTVGKGADSPGWNLWLNVYDPPPREQDKDKDPVADTLTGEACDRPQGYALWTIERRNAPQRRFVREGAHEAPRSEHKEKDLHNAAFPFTLQSGRIVVHAGPYEVGPYSAGAFRTAVRFDDLGATCQRSTT